MFANNVYFNQEMFCEVSKTWWMGNFIEHKQEVEYVLLLYNKQLHSHSSLYSQHNVNMECVSLRK